MNLILFPALLAASLNLNPNTKSVSPGLGNRVVIRTQAVLGSSDPGEYEVGAFRNKDGILSPGDKIEGVRITPSRIFLKKGKSRNVVLSIPSELLKPGPFWICLTEKTSPGTKSFLSDSGARFNVVVRSCYQRLYQPRKSLFQSLLP